ncbi:MATE family efflux transporter [Blautia sp. MSJ-19]|uniref:MATE family efflux transporter n=1 Tax=Blautia sp. MSJ-19 TaxID=2841517 RepID=UPI001C0F078A|nr:MATE family efflux transporter [Blautia sp. MSJ-19]MBU5481764.1 MATE family efflux transporter [Blautia sp. MSJ-19]
MEQKNQITEGVIWKQLLIFFFPIVIGTFFQQVYNTADSIVVGRFVGKEALAAVGGSVNQIVNLVVEVFVGLTSGASVIVAQFYGAKDKKNLNRTLHTSYAFGIVTGFVVGVIGLLVTNTVLELMKTPQELMADSRLYLHIYFCGMIFNIIYNMGASILRAVGDSRRPLYVLMVTCGLNIVFDILLVVIFKLGVMGVALATVSCQGISSILVTAMLMKKHPLFQLKLREIRFYRVSLNSVLRIGIPAALEATMYTIANLIIQVFVNELGTDTVAAWGTFAKIDAVYWMVVNAFGISITTFVGQNYGAGKVKRMRKSVGVCLIMAYAGAILVSATLYVLAEPLYRLFTTDTNVVRIGADMMHFLLPSYFMYVVIGILSGALRGAGRVLVPMILTCGGVCLIRIVWMFGVFPVYSSIETIMLSYPVSWGITAVLFIIYYFRKFPKAEEHILQ